jgi:hypothetical protein
MVMVTTDGVMEVVTTKVEETATVTSEVETMETEKVTEVAMATQEYLWTVEYLCCWVQVE